MKEFKIWDIPRIEIESGSYSPETFKGLMATKQNEYLTYIKKSASKNIPILIGLYLTVCTCFSGYAMSYGESNLIFSEIYFALLYLWIPFVLTLPISWYRRKPTINELIEEIGWYKDLLSRSSELRA